MEAAQRLGLGSDLGSDGGGSGVGCGSVAQGMSPAREGEIVTKSNPDLDRMT